MMTRRDLMRIIKKKLHFLNPEIVDLIIRMYENEITNALIVGDTIKLNSFIKLSTKMAKGRHGILKSKIWTTAPKKVAFAKISPSVQKKIQEYQEQQENMDWLEEFAALSDEEQYQLVKKAKQHVNDAR
jgi:nucleoid DNA-binding protein